MNEYVLNKIIEFKIENDINTEIFMHEYYEYTYKNVKYVDIYFYTKFNIDEIGYVYVDNIKCLYDEKIDDNVKVCTYKRSDLSNNFKITKYFKNKKIVELDNKVTIDYSKYNFNKKYLSILKKMKLKGFSKILVLPYSNKNYYICACGCASKEKECPECGAPKDFVLLYDTEEKIIKNFVKFKYSCFNFQSDDIISENTYFINELESEYNIEINKNILDELSEESKIKLIEYKIKSRNMKYISKILIFVGIILLIVITIYYVIDNKNTRNRNEQIISKYCDSNEYSSRTFDSIISNYKCSDYVYYLLNNDLSDEDIEKIIESNNTEMYQKYYDVLKENLHQNYKKNYPVNSDVYEIDILSFENTIINTTYLDYLYINNYKMDYYAVNKILTLDYLKNDLDAFSDHSKYLTLTKKNEWIYSHDLFNFCGKYDRYLNSYLKEYNLSNCKYDSLIEWAYNYHVNSEDNTCFTTDLFSKDNIKLIYEKDGNCASELHSSMSNKDVPSDVIINYRLVGGDMTYIDFVYKENFFHELASSENISSNLFIEKAKLLYKYGVKVNEISNTLDGKYSTLDYILDNYHSCSNISNGHAYATEVKNCDRDKAKYKYLKSIGAVCNTNCQYEKYFK